MSEQRYLALWKRMRKVVDAHTAAGDRETADYLMIDFFLCFDAIDELERHVKAAEDVAPKLGR